MIVEGMNVQPYTMTPEEVYCFYSDRHGAWSDIKDHLPRLMMAAKGNILEIGVRTGVSTAAFLTGIKARGGHLWSIDIENCNVFPDDPDWTFVQIRPDGNFSPKATFGLKEFDIVFIDGDHSTDACLSDLLRFGILAPKIFLHDYDFPTVKEAVRIFLQDHPEYDKVTYSGSFGLCELNRR